MKKGGLCKLHQRTNFPKERGRESGKNKKELNADTRGVKRWVTKTQVLQREENWKKVSKCGGKKDRFPPGGGKPECNGEVKMGSGTR